MNRLAQLFRTFVKDEAGLETVEYAIIAGVIVVATIGSITTIGNWVNTKFSTLAGSLK